MNTQKKSYIASRAAALSIILWILFLVTENLWLSVMTEAVSSKTGTYGEAYGPLSFFRPIFMYGAFICSVVASISIFDLNK
jgi:hypothetical protein